MILCCGESLIDMIPTDRADAFTPHVGGSVFNTAIGIGRQSVEVGLLSGVSTDLFGRQLEEALEESNVDTSYIIRSERPTTLAFVNVSADGVTYTFYDENTAGRLLGPEDMPSSLPKTVDLLFFGGISLAAEPCADAYLGFLQRNKGNRLVMADPNIRCSFIANESRYRDRLGDLFSCCDIIKISNEDLEWLDPSERGTDKKVQNIISQGPEIVCLTLGSSGVEVYDRSGRLFVTLAPEVQVVDTVGAGDAFNAGLLVGLDRMEAKSKERLSSLPVTQLEGAVAFATAFATDTVTRPGSNPPWDFKV